MFPETPVAQYFGNAERRPRIEIRAEFSPAYDDRFGTVLPRDRIYEGRDAIVSADLNYWDYVVYKQQVGRVPNLDNTAENGTDFADIAVGTMMSLEGVSFPLWLQFPYGGYKFARMPQGYHFLSAFLLGPDDIEPGTMPEMIRAVWLCSRVQDDKGNLKLYDHDMSLVPSLNQYFIGEPPS